MTGPKRHRHAETIGVRTGNGNKILRGEHAKLSTDHGRCISQCYTVLAPGIVVTPGIHGGLDDDIIERRVIHRQPHKITHLMIVHTTCQRHHGVDCDVIRLAVKQCPLLDVEQVFAATQHGVGIVFKAIKLQVHGKFAAGALSHGAGKTRRKCRSCQFQTVGIDANLPESALKQQLDHVKKLRVYGGLTTR